VEVNVVPEGISCVSNRTPLHRTRPKVGSREAGKDLCATRRFHTRRPTHETRLLATAPPEPPIRASPNVQAHPAKLASSTPEEKVVSC